MTGKQVVPVAEMVEKVRAEVAGRGRPEIRAFEDRVTHPTTWGGLSPASPPARQLPGGRPRRLQAIAQ